MKQVPIKLGPLALLLTVISICLTVLAILTFSTAQADVRLAEKYAETVQARYALEIRGQEYLEALSALSGPEREALTRDLADETGVIRTVLEENGARLRIGLLPTDEGYRIVSWQQDKEWNREETLGNLWAGF